MTGVRAALRIAVRDALRSRGRTALVLVMVLVPIAAATVGSVLLRSDELQPRDRVTLRLGADSPLQAELTPSSGGYRVKQGVTDDDIAVELWEDGPPVPAAELPDRLTAIFATGGNRLVPQVLSPGRTVTAAGGRVRADVIEVDVASLGAGAPFSPVRGDAPRTSSEVLVSREMTDEVGVRIGDRIGFTDVAGARELTVVGVFTGDFLGTTRQVVGLPGALLDAPESFVRDDVGTYRYSWLVVGPEPVPWAQVEAANATGVFVLSRAVAADPSQVRVPPELLGDTIVDPDAVVIGAVVVALLLLQVALMVGPAVAVGARRNERMLALVAATGGDRRHLALVVVAGAGVAGLIGSLLGVVLGTGVGAVLVEVLRTRYDRVLPRVDVAVPDLLGLVLVGTLTAAAAAVLPALRVARVDVVAALGGRRRTAAPRLHVPLAGLLVVAVGAAVAWGAASQGSAGGAVLGIGVLEVGLVLAASAVVAFSARLARRAPFGARFALRDAARQRGRTAPAVAATMAAVAAASCFFVYQQADLRAREAAFRQNVPLGATYVTLDPGQGAERYSAADVEAAVRSVLPVTAAGVRSSAADEGDVDVSVSLRYTGGCEAGFCYGSSLQTWFVAPDDAPVVVPDPSSVAALRAGRAVVYEPDLIADDGTVTLTVSRYREQTTGEIAEETVTVPAVLAAGPQRLESVLVPAEVAARLGVTLQPETLVVRTARPPTAGEDVALADALARLDPTQSWLGASTQAPYSASDAGADVASLVALALAVLVALAGTFTAVGLAAADARPDLGTLAAVGADPAVRRRIGAAQAAAVAVPGTVLGVAAGVGAGWVLIRLNSVASYYAFVDWTYGVPVVPTLALLVGVPLLAVALGWLTVRSRLEVVRRARS